MGQSQEQHRSLGSSDESLGSTCERVLLASSLPVGLRRRLCAQLGIPSHAMDWSQDGFGWGLDGACLTSYPCVFGQTLSRGLEWSPQSYPGTAFTWILGKFSFSGISQGETVCLRDKHRVWPRLIRIKGNEKVTWWSPVCCQVREDPSYVVQCEGVFPSTLGLVCSLPCLLKKRKWQEPAHFY